MRRLSRQQQHILAHLVRLYNDTAPAERETVGIPWGIVGSRSWQASASRTLRRLEARGLLVRLRHPAGQATGARTYVRLLSAGLDVAKQLTSRSDSGC
jgi:hypothetical protein